MFKKVFIKFFGKLRSTSIVTSDEQHVYILDNKNKTPFIVPPSSLLQPTKIENTDLKEYQDHHVQLNQIIQIIMQDNL